MCKYCEISKYYPKDRNIWDDDIEKCYIGWNDTGNKYFFIHVDCECGYDCRSIIDIKYCPFCGRSLYVTNADILEKDNGE